MGNMLISGPSFAPGYIEGLKKKESIHEMCESLTWVLLSGLALLTKKTISPQEQETLREKAHFESQRFACYLRNYLSSDIDGVLEMAAQPPPKLTPEMLIEATRQRERIQNQLAKLEGIFGDINLPEHQVALGELMMDPIREQLRLAEKQVSAIQRALEEQAPPLG